MLQSLSIRDVVLIEKLDLEFGEGLSVLTGETGAGKSILLDALGLALGARADGNLIRQGAEKSQVIATFKVSSLDQISGILSENEIPFEDGNLLLKRILGRDGRSKSFVNDVPVSLSFLRDVGGRLLEIHGQFDRLLDANAHLEALDRFSAAENDLSQVSDSFFHYQKAKKALDEAISNLQNSQVREAYLKVSIEDLRALSPKIDEESTLLEKRKQVAHQSKIANATEEALSSLLGDQITTRLGQAHKSLARIEEYISDRVNPILSQLDEALNLVQSAAFDVQDLHTQVLDDHQSLQEIDERLYALRQMARKHQVEADNLSVLFQEMEAEFGRLSQGEAGLEDLEKASNQAKSHYYKLAMRLSEKRKVAAENLAIQLKSELEPLKLGHVQFEVQFETLPEERWGRGGIDTISFVVATNPGSAPGPLAKIASGGELSRLMLALKVVLSDKMAIPTMIFDEIDTGTGGAVADAMGKRLKSLSKGVQILAITHSPQVATSGDHHIHVFKIIEEGAPRTDVIVLEPQDRIEEVARMLSGANITEEARAQALRLLGR
ncbi:DNA repair protein RecN [Candidatus Bealeia paramacronuclearis]|uniref:DNA repair protein RecN n=1 Tax=Candidatus Bealeia paramacronuclearis TaxID=1921001 RepID=A0ABZ2C7M8_9PROT|nr:DNA repair protein RecN [Candidatus Bealeia paramacronuclearis]